MKKPPFPQRRPTRLRDFDYGTPNIVVFVTASTRGERNLFVEPDVNRAIVRCFLEERERLGHSIFAYCLMPDHYHLLCSPNQSGTPITRLIGGINSKITRLLWNHGHSGRLMQRSFYDHIVRREESLTEIMEYILNNPVRKGLVERAEDYPYSDTVDPLPL
jgi:putative transposase